MPVELEICPMCEGQGKWHVGQHLGQICYTLRCQQDHIICSVCLGLGQFDREQWRREVLR